MNLIKKYLSTWIACIIVGILACITYFQKSVFFSFVEYPYLWIGGEIIVLLSIIAFSFCKTKENKVIGWLIFLIAPLLMEICVEMLNGNMLWDIDMFANVLMNYFINILFYSFVYAISGSLQVSICFTSTVLEIFGIANYYVKTYKGSPLLPWDLSAIQTATKVSNAFSFALTKEIIISVSILVLVFFIARLAKANYKKNILYRLIAGSTFCFITLIFYCTDFVAVVFGATPDFFNQTRGYEAKGAIAEFVINTRYMHLGEPDNYDPSTLEENITNATQDSPTILETALQHSGKSEAEIQETMNTPTVKNPNIIIIMNESFSDLSVIGDFETNEDYMPFINRLKDAENCISGYSYVSTIGTGTSNTEYEFLTGNSMAFLPIGSNAYQLYIKNKIPSLVSTLEDQNYTSAAFHPYYKENWNRINVYNNMGFDSYTGYGNYGDFEKLRLFVSDENDFEHVETLYENRDTSKPFFLFNVTMQNHSSYDQVDTDWYQQIKLQNMKGTYPETEQYLSLIKETDDAFANLISYFSTVDEPTIILMYGDHQPYIEDSFYEEVMGKKITELSDEEQQKRYITRFVLWANYDIPEGWIDEISVNYLSTLLMQISGNTLTPYQQYLNTLYTKMPVITMMGIKDWEGNYYTVHQDNPYAYDLNLYEQACYNNVIDDKKRIHALYKTQKK